MAVAFILVYFRDYFKMIYVISVSESDSFDVEDGLFLRPCFFVLLAFFLFWGGRGQVNEFLRQIKLVLISDSFADVSLDSSFSSIFDFQGLRYFSYW